MSDCIKFVVICLVVLLSSSYAFAQDKANYKMITRDRSILKFDETRLGYRYTIKPKGDYIDPVPLPSEDDFGKLKKKLSKKQIKDLVESFVDRASATYAEKYKWEKEFVEYLNENKSLRKIFITALEPRYDNIPSATKVLNTLRGEYPELVIKYPHLAVACAVVYDEPNALYGSRSSGIWGACLNQFPKYSTASEIFEYFTNKKNRKKFAFDLKRIPWPLLIYLVDIDISKEERAWALKNYSKKKGGIGALYSSITYDNQKLETRVATLGSNDYTLKNLQKYGGVCGDQSYFTTRVAKACGIPAVTCSGKGRYGGNGHAWSGFLKTGKKLKIEFTGRYNNDFYYTGNVFNPQTRTIILDRELAIWCDGAVLSYSKFVNSAVLTRIAEGMIEKNPKLSLTLARAAVNQNYYNHFAWACIMRNVKNKTISAKEGVKLFNIMLKKMKAHPDATSECLQVFLGALPKKNLKQRQSMYEQTYKLYKDRPDLRLDLRKAQCEELIEAKKVEKAINTLISTIEECASEGSIVLPFVKQAVDIANEYKVEKQVKKLLKKAEAKFPKKRGATTSSAYKEFKRMLKKLD